ncbi:MAG: hypothetical protein AB7O29_13790, partial [Acidimicrobiia bacterium]
AEATQVDVELRAEGSAITLTVVDNGVGPPVDAVPRGNGLHNMERRALVRDGGFELAAGAGGGTCLRWWVPRDVRAGSLGRPATRAQARSRPPSTTMISPVT